MIKHLSQVHNQMCALAQNVGSHIAQPFVQAKTICICYCCIYVMILLILYDSTVQLVVSHVRCTELSSVSVDNLLVSKLENKVRD